MQDFSWYNIIWGLLLAVMIWRMWPTAMHWMKNGPVGSSSDWMTTAILLGGVVLFVVLLILAVR
ncbi:MAG: hypothetical protein WBD13_09525 [Burkholderiaceae bacterium]